MSQGFYVSAVASVNGRYLGIAFSIDDDDDDGIYRRLEAKFDLCVLKAL